MTSTDRALERRVRDAFDALEPPVGLNEATLAAIEAQRPRPAAAVAKRRRPAARVLAIAACLALALVGCGAWAVKTPVAYVSVDVNPSVELSLNRFDTVVAQEGVNDDGAALLANVNLVGMGCEEAIATLTGSEAFAPYATAESFVELSVVGNDEAQVSRLMRVGEGCIERLACESRCGFASSGDRSAARAAGMGVGRYNAACELIALDPTLAMEDCANMSMRELRNRIEAAEDASAQGEDAPGWGEGRRMAGENGRKGAGEGRGRGRAQG